MDNTTNNGKRKLFVYTVIISIITTASVFLPLFFGIGGSDVIPNKVDSGIFYMLLNVDQTAFTNTDYMICMVIAGWPTLAFGLSAVAIGITAFIGNSENQIAVYKKLNLGCLICSLTYSLFGIIDMIVGFSFESYVLPLNWIYSIPVVVSFIGFTQHCTICKTGENAAPSKKSKIAVLSTIVASAVIVSLSIGLGLGLSNSEGKTVVKDGISYQFQTVRYSYAGGSGTLNGYVVVRSENVNTDQLIIPNRINGCDVVAIGDFALTEIPCKEVLLPGSITTIGQAAFQRCPNLTKVMAPVISIEASAFYDCMSLETVVTTAYGIGSSAFSGCVNLKTITCSENLKAIGPTAFSNCLNLAKFDFPKNLETIGAGAFARTGLANVDLTNTRVATIEAGAFRDCDKLATVDLGRYVKTISEEAFYDCDNLVGVRLGWQLIGDSGHTVGNIAEIKEDAFEGCEKLASITYFNAESESLSSERIVVIPTTVTDIGNISGNIFYMGSKEDWNKVNKTNFYGTVYYYRSSNPYEYDPTDEDLYWHFVNGTPVVWEKQGS